MPITRNPNGPESLTADMPRQHSGARRALTGAPVVAVALALWWLPPPAGLRPEAMHLLAVFAAAIAGLMLQPLPQGAVVVTALAVVAVSGTLPFSDVLAGYSDSTVWLIVSAFILARGFIVTGLGRRIAYLLVRAFGHSTLGLGYALTVADAVLAPATPSNTARAGGILYPVVRSLAGSLGSEPGPTARKAGAFLLFTEFQVNLVTSALFLTGVAPNAMIVKLAADTLDVRITWMGWFAAAVVPAALSLAILPWLIYRMLPPETRRSAHAAEYAAQQLAQMGPMTGAEKRMALVFTVTLALWATGQWTGLNATAVALAGISALLLLPVLRWDQVLAERGAWDALVWFGGLVSLTTGLAKLGLIDLLAREFQTLLQDVSPWQAGFVMVVLAYVYAHYAVASMTAHAAALYVPLALVAVGMGAPPALAALVLGFMNSLNAAMTTYGTGPSPIYFGSGYIDQATWWRCGFYVSLVNVVIWIAAGGIWWKCLGLW